MSGVEILTAAEITALLNAARRAKKHARTNAKLRGFLQDIVMIQTARYTGASGPELCRLGTDDVDFTRETMTLGIGGRAHGPRTIPLSRKLRPLLEKWIASILPGPLFSGPSGELISPRTFRRRLAALAKAAGLSKRTYPHLLRHTFLDAVLRSGANLAELRALLGVAQFEWAIEHLTVDLGRMRSAVDRV